MFDVSSSSPFHTFNFLPTAFFTLFSHSATTNRIIPPIYHLFVIVIRLVKEDLLHQFHVEQLLLKQRYNKLSDKQHDAHETAHYRNRVRKILHMPLILHRCLIDEKLNNREALYQVCAAIELQGRWDLANVDVILLL